MQVKSLRYCKQKTECNLSDCSVASRSLNGETESGAFPFAQLKGKAKKPKSCIQDSECKISHQKLKKAKNRAARGTISLIYKSLDSENRRHDSKNEAFTSYLLFLIFNKRSASS